MVGDLGERRGVAEGDLGGGHLGPDAQGGRDVGSFVGVDGGVASEF